MIRRRTFCVVATVFATLVAAGCEDTAMPTAVAPKGTPRGPSYSILTASDITYPVPHGTLRIYDQTMLDAGGNDLFLKESVVPNERIRFTGKWQVGPITNVDDC